ncbi:hypothetical protein ACIQUQ_27975 [Streptomyces sp. NPDC101118]|uniref:hypothetical protein n=1 Tax=Streptomyces sp. NPDC101118 TaxID=3366109 RepID=UPI0037F6A486
MIEMSRRARRGVAGGAFVAGVLALAFAGTASGPRQDAHRLAERRPPLEVVREAAQRALDSGAASTHITQFESPVNSSGQFPTEPYDSPGSPSSWRDGTDATGGGTAWRIGDDYYGIPGSGSEWGHPEVAWETRMSLSVRVSRELELVRAVTGARSVGPESVLGRHGHHFMAGPSVDEVRKLRAAGRKPTPGTSNPDHVAVDAWVDDHGELVRIIVTDLGHRVLIDFESFGGPTVTLPDNAEPMP